MNFNSIGNMNNYLRTTELKSMWNLRKKNNDYASKGQERLDQMFERMYGKNGEAENGSDSRLSEIRNKLNAGGKLSPDEMEYLRQKDPKTYNDLKQEELEQEAFEKRLRRCKTKEEVERLKMSRINQSLSTISSVENNSAIPKGEKLGIILREGRRMKRMEESVEKFVRSGEFSKLPTEAEEALARKEEAERKKAEKTPEEPIREETEPIEKPEESAEPAQTDAAQEPIQAEKPEMELETPEEKKANQAKTAANAPHPFDWEPAVDSPELRKVRRARAKAAYAAHSPEFSPRSISSLDRNA